MDTDKFKELLELILITPFTLEQLYQLESTVEDKVVATEEFYSPTGDYYNV